MPLFFVTSGLPFSYSLKTTHPAKRPHNEQLIMNRTKTAQVVALSLGLLAAAPVTRATPLQQTDVAADPVWLLHVDCDRLRPTAVGQHLLAEMEKPNAQNKLAAFQAMFKFDLRTQLHGLTLYSVGQSPEEGVLLVYADFDADHLSTLAKGARDYESSPHNQRVIHSWVDDSKMKSKDSKQRTYAAAQGSRLLIFGQRAAAVAKALDVLDVAAPNLTVSKSFPALESKSAFLQGAAQKMTLKNSDPNAAVFRMSKSLRFEIGEEQNRVNATLQLTANDDEVAKQIVSIGQGLVSLMKLQKDRPEAGKLADALTLKQEASDVVVSFSIPVGDAIDLMKADAARKAKKDE